MCCHTASEGAHEGQDVGGKGGGGAESHATSGAATVGTEMVCFFLWRCCVGVHHTSVVVWVFCGGGEDDVQMNVLVLSGEGAAGARRVVLVEVVHT